MKYRHESKANSLLSSKRKLEYFILSFSSVLPEASHLQMINVFLLPSPILLPDLSSLTEQFTMALDSGFITGPDMKQSSGGKGVKSKLNFSPKEFFFFFPLSFFLFYYFIFLKCNIIIMTQIWLMIKYIALGQQIIIPRINQEFT